MQAGLAGELAVVVVGRVQRHVRVLDVVTRDGGEQHGVGGSVDVVSGEAFEGLAQVVELLGLPPRQHADALQRVAHQRLVPGGQRAMWRRKSRQPEMRAWPNTAK